MRRNWLLLVMIVAAVVALDQLTKHAVLSTMALGETRQPVPALVPFFQFTRSENTGSAFGFLPNAGDLFLIIALVVVTAMFVFYPRIPADGHLTRVAIGLICGGALGNALDRLQHGPVIDFIHYQIPGLISNVSNLADHAIVFGVLLVLVDGWRGDRARRRAEKTAMPADADAGET
ncbi:MAG: signal peptidase II [Aggregatilineales bacterium]